MSTSYTINVINQSGANKSYVVFQAPPPTPGGQTPVYADAWATLENISNNGFDSVSYTTESSATEPRRFLIAEGDYAPGQVVGPPDGANVATVDFTDRPQTTATVTAQADESFSVSYA